MIQLRETSFLFRSASGLWLAGILGLSVGSAESRAAEASLAQDADLAACLEYAVNNNAGLKAAHAKWREAVERIPEARGLPDPRLSYGYFVRSVETRVGPQRHKLGVAQTLPWFGKRRLRGEIAGSGAQALFEAAAAEKWKLFHRVRHTWHELAYLRRAIEITENNLRLLQDLEAVAQTKVQGGGGLSGVAAAQLELGRLEDRKQTLLDLRRPLTARFNAALGRSVDSEAPWPGSDDVSAREVDEARLFEWLAEFNPELRGLEQETVSRRKRVELARKNKRPDLTLGVDYTQTDRRGLAGLGDDGKDPLMAMISINVPLWRKKEEAAIRAAEARRGAVEAARADRERLLKADLTLALHRFRDAERKMDLYRDTLAPLAEQSLSVAQQSWEAGRAEFLNVIDAERQLLEFRLLLARARADREQCLSEIEMLVGRALPPSAKGQAAKAQE